MNDNNDHDLLIRLDTKLSGLIKQVEDLDSNIVKRVEALEISSTKNVEEHKNFVPRKYLYLAMGAIGIIQFVIGYILISKFGNTPL